MKLQKSQLMNHIHEIQVMDNPRLDNGDMGPQFCHLCGSHTTSLIRIILGPWTPDPPSQIVFCKGCLEGMSALASWGVMEQIKQSVKDIEIGNTKDI